MSCVPLCKMEWKIILTKSFTFTNISSSTIVGDCCNFPTINTVEVDGDAKWSGEQRVTKGPGTNHLEFLLCRGVRAITRLWRSDINNVDPCCRWDRDEPSNLLCSLHRLLPLNSFRWNWVSYHPPLKPLTSPTFPIYILGSLISRTSQTNSQTTCNQWVEGFPL